MTTTLITDDFDDDGRVKCTCAHLGEPLVDHDGECAVVKDAINEMLYWDHYLGEDDA